MATSSRFSPFTTRVVCGCCGSSCRRQTQPSKLSETGKIAYWRCSGGAKTNCGIKGIREPELMEITAQVMGTPEFDGEAFRERVDHITMVESGKLEYTFLDGHTQEAEYSTEKPRPPLERRTESQVQGIRQGQLHTRAPQGHERTHEESKE